MPPTDPLIYRFYEMVMVNGPAWKALIEEEFGDGIMSAIDFNIEFEREPNPKGDRVQIAMSGKFLPYKYYGNEQGIADYGVQGEVMEGKSTCSGVSLRNASWSRMRRQAGKIERQLCAAFNRYLPFRLRPQIGRTGPEADVCETLQIFCLLRMELSLSQTQLQQRFS